jgi:hypothetical protein
VTQQLSRESDEIAPLVAMSAADPVDVRFAPLRLAYELRQLGDTVARLELLAPRASMAATAVALDAAWGLRCAG